MRRGSLAYPLQRAADADQGGAAELQTDVMRFMAILSLCLVAIFALVQSLPVAPAPAPETVEEAAKPPQTVTPKATEPVAVVEASPTTPALARSLPPPVVPEPQPEPLQPVPATNVGPAPAENVTLPTPSTNAPSPGFTLRFASDAALMQTVAARRVGFYAISSDRALRMTVSDSRISFWDASVPGTIHEMEPTTVPAAVSDALQRSGVDTATVTWGVTLPGRLKSELDELLRTHDDGALVITADGDIHREAT